MSAARKKRLHRRVAVLATAVAAVGIAIVGAVGYAHAAEVIWSYVGR